MQAYDILMLVVLGGAVAFGAWKGFAWQIASLGSIFASYFVAYQFRSSVASLIGAEEPWNMFLAMLILFLATSLVIWLAFGAISGVIDKMKLKDFDRQVGAMFGLAKGVVLCTIVTLFAVTLLGEQQKESICNSRSGYYIARLLDEAHGVMPGEVHEVLHPYIHHLDPNHAGGALMQSGHDHELDEHLHTARETIGAAVEHVKNR